jgi:hypothetical protein
MTAPVFPDSWETLAARFVRARSWSGGREVDATWLRGTRDGGWSAAQCLEHLNLRGEALLPRVEEGLVRARGLAGGGRPRRDLVGWLLAQGSGPRVWLKLRTPAPFSPPPHLDPRGTLERFRRLQDRWLDVVEAAAGLPLDRVKIRSPFDARVSYNLLSALDVAAAHQERHLAQAERALGA